jgi:hypothetical protein
MWRARGAQSAIDIAAPGRARPDLENSGRVNMNARINKLLQLPLLLGSIAATLVGGIAIASLAIHAEGANEVSAPTEAPAALESPASAETAVRSYRCADCGVIESTREIDAPGRIDTERRGGIEAKRLPNYEITIRLHDGSIRVIRDAKPAKWRRGESVTVIAGAG